LTDNVRSLPVRGPIRLGAVRRLTVYAVALGVWTTGCLWLLFHYFMRQPTEFGFEVHPLEPVWLKLHGAFAFAALWMVGLLSANHMVNGWAAKRRRWSGVLLLAFVTIMIITAYLLYYAGTEETRKYASVIHWSLGISVLIAFVWHRFHLVNRKDL
jgi:hypothetical protein